MKETNFNEAQESKEENIDVKELWGRLWRV